MIPFDPLSVPLTGTHLIEASAGTGKTFAIASLFLRLVVVSGVPVDKILVVTFTQSATAELRDRIRRRLSEALRELRSSPPDDAFLAALVADPETAVSAAPRLSAALADFDRAPILTIHGFCNRILQDHAFDTGTLFDAELVADVAGYRLQVADDFWRRHVTTLPPLAARCVQNIIPAPESLLAGGRRSMNPTVAVLPPPAAALPEADLAQITAAHRELAKDWQRCRGEVVAVLGDPALNGTVFGSLKSDTLRPGRTVRDIRLAARAAVIDTHLATDIPDLSVPKALSQITTDAIARYTRKGQTAPAHPFFDRCADYVSGATALEAAMAAFTADLRYRFFRHLDDAMASLKTRDRVLFYDDLLMKVHRALASASPGADALVRAIREQYRCALVDEFQDTDGLQYRIFTRLFHAGDALLFMIGDPKQAIYAFRGADIFSYLEASRNAHSVFTLDTNWRSTGALVKAVNTLFSMQTHPFVMTGLSFEPVTAGSPDTGGPLADAPAMVIWRLPDQPGDSRDQRLTVAAGEQLSAAAVAAEIMALCHGDLSPADMAVLVRTNEQARTVRRHLTAHGIPCVLHSSESVFGTPEATELWQVLHCLAGARGAAVLRAALTTELLGVELSQLGLPEDEDDAALARHRESVSRLSRLWSATGFMRMFTELLTHFDTRHRFLAGADGERRLTNLRHLAELLHAAEREGRSPLELTLWLAGRIDTAGDDGDEAAQLRLETDAGAVTIVTIHKSKGLEYPVVFCPFLWRDALWVTDPPYYHDPANGHRETVDFGSPHLEAGRSQALKEMFAENLRLAYVALTRARHRGYILWDRRLPADGAAMAYLIHGCGPPGDIRPDSGGNWPAGLFSSLTPERFDSDLDRLEVCGEGAIRVVSVPQPDAGEMYRPQRMPPGSLHPRRFSVQITDAGRVVSYSGLTAGSDPGAHGEGLDRDGTRASAVTAPTAVTRRGMAAFPRGAVAGSLFHEIMETIDYRRPGATETIQAVARILGDYGYDPDWRDTLVQCVADVLKTPLPMTGGGRTALCQLQPEDRVCEMAFTFPLKRIAPADLQAVFTQAKVYSGDPSAIRWPERLSFSPVHGHMKGFIDLWFRYGGRYYVLDWKTNYLGPQPADYSAPRVAAAMLEGDYHLQYHLYVLALHLYLQRRHAGYSYERHFGGVLYLFVRGMTPAADPGAGIFIHRPDPAVIDALEARLVDRERTIRP